MLLLKLANMKSIKLSKKRVREKQDKQQQSTFNRTVSKKNLFSGKNFTDYHIFLHFYKDYESKQILRDWKAL